MSWQEYIDKQLMASGVVKHAAIAGHDGAIWAKSEQFNTSDDDLLNVSKGFGDKGLLQTSGLTIGGERYIYLSGDDKIIRAKKGKIGVHCMKTKQAIVVALYEDPVQPQQCATVVEKLGEYLENCGY
ncbi:hypothetical protein CHUAL_002404 [Chamberlinius hualienensis]